MGFGFGGEGLGFRVQVLGLQKLGLGVKIKNMRLPELMNVWGLGNERRSTPLSFLCSRVREATGHRPVFIKRPNRRTLRAWLREEISQHGGAVDNAWKGTLLPSQQLLLLPSRRAPVPPRGGRLPLPRRRIAAVLAEGAHLHGATAGRFGRGEAANFILLRRIGAVSDTRGSAPGRMRGQRVRVRVWWALAAEQLRGAGPT